MIGDEALDVYNAFTWDSRNDKIKIDKVLEQFDNFCEPRRKEFMKGISFSHEARRAVSLDKYATVLRNMDDNCEFQELKNSLIRDPPAKATVESSRFNTGQSVRHCKSGRSNIFRKSMSWKKIK